MTTCILPDGWRHRLVKVQNRNTAAPAGVPQFVGWCLDKDDLCVAKLCAGREKDLNFVSALLQSGLVSAQTVADRCAGVEAAHRPSAARAVAWLDRWIS
ncbi:DUF6036 family nucleotidyltransferase [Cellulomonas sp. S1-8]|uniref:DUF6036 family nucleotidyltransferase n=1 Tax=Cellulomonas sp. S1-8 TaxID=2904790 RepID=UPI0022443D12|nr:DUF6036 family nucleotidyltransferase [Cellulomonas sp. S1-8]UZN01769.1 hypothetical protein OKX07_11740 [Cellulomonas sp. S1-8]